VEDAIQDRKNSQAYTIVVMSCVLWNMEVIKRTKLKPYKTTLTNTVLYAAGA
jgi:hypothetical protein